MSQWQQNFVIPGVEEIGQLFDEADKKRGKGKKRHTYKSKGTRTKIMEDIPTEELIQEEAIDDHLFHQKVIVFQIHFLIITFLCFMVKYLMIG